MASDSILTSVKKVIGITENDTSFDVDILMHINTVFSKLTQLGYGPTGGFRIDDKTTTWDAYILGDDRRNMLQTYTYLVVKSVFDPPGSSYAVTAMTEQIREFESRLSILREDDEWTPPVIST